jgi:TrmH family RNA methyltransferase
MKQERPLTKALIQSVAALKQKKFREETGRLLVEARHPIEEAVRAGLTLRELFFLKDAPADSLPKVHLPQPPMVTDEAAMARMASTSSPPPCLAVFDAPQASQRVRGSLALVLDGLQDPGNLGTLIRSAVAFGFETVILTENSAEPYSPKVIRSSAGLVFALTVIETSCAALADLLPPSGWKVFTTSGQPQAQSYREVDYAGPCAIVLGNEGRGVSAAMTAMPSVQPITIPMAAGVESLNVAVSGSVIMAEVAAYRRNRA